MKVSAYFSTNNLALSDVIEALKSFNPDIVYARTSVLKQAEIDYLDSIFLGTQKALPPSNSQLQNTTQSPLDKSSAESLNVEPSSHEHLLIQQGFNEQRLIDLGRQLASNQSTQNSEFSLQKQESLIKLLEQKVAATAPKLEPRTYQLQAFLTEA